MRRFVPIVLAALALAAPSVVGAADQDVLQPGDRIGTTVGNCTLSFVFDGEGALAGMTYFSTAAHCVQAVGDSVSAVGAADFARVAFICENGFNGLDWALLEVKPAFVAKVSPEVKGHAGAPAGYTVAGEARTGDVLRFSGYGFGFDQAAATREGRSGVLLAQGAAEYRALAPIVPGDSGGPVLHESGKALGIVSRIEGVDVGPTLEGVLAEAQARGITVRLRTV